MKAHESSTHFRAESRRLHSCDGSRETLRRSSRLRRANRTYQLEAPCPGRSKAALVLFSLTFKTGGYLTLATAATMSRKEFITLLAWDAYHKMDLIVEVNATKGGETPEREFLSSTGTCTTHKLSIETVLAQQV